MRTREQLYSQEGADLLRDISMYPGLCAEQLCRFYPGKENKVRTLLSHLTKQGRILPAGGSHYFMPGEDVENIDIGMQRAVWILLDFMDRVQYHTVGDFPVKIVFFAGGEMYEIVYVQRGQEALVSHAMSQKPEGAGRRIVLVEAAEQIELLNIPETSGYCTVDENGAVNYYQKESEGGP